MKHSDPDGRNSWQVMAASFFIRFLSFGIVEVGGLFLLPTMFNFDVTREEASWPYTITYCVRNGLGPFIGYVGHKIGIRYATLIGCIITSIAMGSCFFVTSLWAITFFWGFLLGIGLAFETLFLDAIMVEHFNKHLTTATAFSDTGVQLGNVFFALLVYYLLKYMGLSGTFLILSGLTLNSIPACLYMLLNQPEKHRKETASMRKARIKKPSSIVRKIDNEKGLDSLDSKNYANAKTEEQDTHTTEAIVPYHTMKTRFQKLRPSLETSTNVDNSKFSKDIVSNEADISSIFLVRDMINKIHFDPDNNLIYTATKLNDVSKDQAAKESMNSPSTLSRKMSKSCISTAPQTVMMFLFTCPTFLLLLFSGGVYYFSISIFITILPNYAMDIGIDASYSDYVLIGYSVSELVGNLFLGYFMNNVFVDYSYNRFAAFCFMSQCLCVLWMVWNENHIIFAFLIVVNQFAVSGQTFTYPSIIIESIGREFAPPALASLFILSSPLILCISPMIGYFRDYRGCYDGVFYIISAMSLFACMLHLAIPKVNEHRRKNQDKIRVNSEV